ncbi:hypothetical protein PV11_07060 [Exophiala sideris]|uniref:Amidohydrolase-related domain-containing protein n=1 Tax=Exophiala sideris TaxID=1016849 RepID=A0A0D1WWH8_9EURO|nr:hypothetical protein PV11_07060 [Exophiala sideris]
MTAAFYLGLIAPPANSSTNIKAQCPSGNCTFQQTSGASYSSIAMCSECADISGSIQNNNYTEDGNYSLPSGCSIKGDSVVANTMYVYENSGDRDQNLFTFDTLLTRMDPNTSAPWTAVAIRCSLYPCVNTYAGNVSNGVLEERLVSSQRMGNYGAGTTEWFSLAANQTLRKGIWSECTWSQAPMSPTDVCSSPTTSPWPGTFEGCWPNDCVWTLGVAPTVGIQSVLDELFDNQTASYFDSNPAGPLWVQNLWNIGAGDLKNSQKVMDGLANAITAVMRQQGDNSSAGLAMGTVQALQTCIGVNWAWLSFPVALLILSIVFFLIATIKVSLSPMRRVWRSSLLTLLFHGLSKELLREEVDYGSSPEDAAHQVKARLECHEDDFSFTKVGATDEHSIQGPLALSTVPKAGRPGSAGEDIKEFGSFLPPSGQKKNREVLVKGLDALKLATDTGVKVCFGTDLLGSMTYAQSQEFSLRAKVLPAKDILLSATVSAAKLLRQEHFLGKIEESFAADILLFDANPLEDVTILDRPAEHLLATIKDGRVVSSRWEKLKPDNESSAKMLKT